MWARLFFLFKKEPGSTRLSYLGAHAHVGQIGQSAYPLELAKNPDPHPVRHPLCCPLFFCLFLFLCICLSGPSLPSEGSVLWLGDFEAIPDDVMVMDFGVSFTPFFLKPEE